MKLMSGHVHYPNTQSFLLPSHTNWQQHHEDQLFALAAWSKVLIHSRRLSSSLSLKIFTDTRFVSLPGGLAVAATPVVVSPP
ncbi:1413_t:CDS:2, partial [Cetraspora pellucida]